MTEAQKDPSPSAGKGKAFFDRAEEVADTGSWDFAIELYLEGIQFQPQTIAWDDQGQWVAAGGGNAQPADSLIRLWDLEMSEPQVQVSRYRRPRRRVRLDLE